MEVGLVRLVQLVCQARLVRVVWGSSPSAVPPIVCPIVRLIVVVPIFADLQFLKMLYGWCKINVIASQSGDGGGGGAKSPVQE
ncbi:hypothetical protein DERP_007019 [Dermatophagoides pteronyssinus]|uniref:Secreted protein n=1 Tax=Dermatophagoides pteronyssinus TaxID=6956 RepID=A0ABQ8JTY6_DERPT|nr:hypothetical protein DERP_007019 [Dermatophagoides pteronyssinus]